VEKIFLKFKDIRGGIVLVGGERLVGNLTSCFIFAIL